MRSTPPPSLRRRHWVPAKFREIQTTPNKWRRVRIVDSYSQASPIRARFVALGCEAVTRKTRSGRVAVWAMWPGEAKS